MGRSRYRIFSKEDETPYFLTSTIMNWLPLFGSQAVVEFVLNSLSFMQTERGIIIYAYVIMENHLHLIAAGKNLAKIFGDFKSYTARCIIDYFQDKKASHILRQLQYHKLRHKKDRTYQLWQEGSHPEQIQSEDMMTQKIEYIHYNPVKRGYVDEPEHWRYSSARNYAGMPGLIEITTEW